MTARRPLVESAQKSTFLTVQLAVCQPVQLVALDMSFTKALANQAIAQHTIRIVQPVIRADAKLATLDQCL